MPLSDSLISQFAKATNDDKKTSKETTVYGTIVEYEGSKYVKIDGSELLTPVTFTTNVEDDERVTVMIKDHTAIVTGNISSPAARTAEVETVGSKISEFETIVADKVSAEYVDANYASIETLNAGLARINDLETYNVEVKGTLAANEANIKDLLAENVEITGKLTATEAEVDSLQADNVSINGKLTANTAAIDTLTTDNVTINETLTANTAAIEDLSAKKLSAESADLKYANIDFSNIGEASIRKIFADTGLIQDLVVGDSTITGNLVGVTISGDLIEGNTIKAEKLVVKGSDGLYYKLNVGAGATTSEEVSESDLQNGLHGSAIIAKTITADRISVTDLVAFGATIGGINLDEGIMYSGVKESIDNTTRGFYMDKDGQFVVGDANSFLKFYEDSDGTYKLDISASRILLGGGNSNKTVEDAVDELQTGIENAQSSIDNMEVGVRNYLRNTRSMDTYYRHTNSTATFIEDDEGFGVVDYSAASTRSWDNVIATIPKLYYNQVRNKTMTFSVMLRSNDGGSWVNDDRAVVVFSLAENGMTNGLRVAYALVSNIRNITTEWVKYTCTVTLTDEVMTSNRVAGYEDYVINDSTFFFVQVYNYSTKHLELKQLKLEEGNIATDWTPAPEDSDLDISDVKNIATNIDTRLKDVQLLVDQIKGAIDLLVIGEDNKTLMEQIDTGWKFNFSSIDDVITGINTSISDLQDDTNITNDIIGQLQTNIEQFGDYTEYIRFITKNGEPCISLGEEDSDFTLDITNTGIEFAKGSWPLATISGNSMKIKKVIIEEELQQGGYVWISRPSGNYGLAWKGE